MNCLEIFFELLKIAVDLLKGIAWPLAIFLSVLVFRNEVKQLLPRVRKVGTGGVELDPRDQQQLPAPDTTVQSTDLTEKAAPAIEAIENRIKSDLENILPDRKEPLLIRQLAEARAAAFFENTYGLIFGSQLSALKRLSEIRNTSIEEAREYYVSVLRPLLPDSFQKTGFDEWSGFLVTRGLVTIDHEKIEITETGEEFLKFLKQNNRPMKKAL